MVSNLPDDLTARRSLGQRALSRRNFVRLAGAGVAGTAFASLLAACGGTPPEVTPAPTGTTPPQSGGETTPTTGEGASSPTTEPSTGEIKEGGTLNLGIADIITLNPFAANLVIENFILQMLYPSLATLDPDSSRVPYVAESWETSEDGKTVTLKLAEGYLWEDGEPLTAGDVKFTADFEAEHKFTWRAGLLDVVESMEVPDDYTLVVNLTDPAPWWLGQFSFWFRIMPQHVWEAIDDPKSYTNEKPIGAGPFSVVRWEKGQFIEMEARKDYDYPAVGRPPYIDRLIYHIYPDVNTLVLAFQNGDIDVVPSGVPVDSVDTVRANPDFEVLHNPSTGYNYVAFNIAQNEVLQDVRVRRALAMGVDKDAIVELVLKGNGGKMITSVSPVLTEWFNPDVEDWPFDIEAGKALLEEAGATGVTLRLSYNSTNADAKKITPMLKENWEKLGVTIVLDGSEGAALRQQVIFNHDFDLYFAGWGIDDDPVFGHYLNFHSSQYFEGSNNMVGINDPEFDDLIMKAYTAPSVEEAREYVMQQQVMEHELLPYIALYYPEFLLAYNKARWTGFQVRPGSLMGIVSYQSIMNVHQV